MRSRTPWPILILLAAVPAAAAQDPVTVDAEHEEEVRDATQKSGVPLEALESANFCWAVAINKSQARPIQESAEKAFAAIGETLGIDGWEQIWGPTPQGTRKALIVILKDRTQYTKVLAWYQERFNPWAGFKDEAAKVSYWPQPTPRCAILVHLKPLSLEGLGNVVVHEIGHLAAMRYRFHNNFLPPWLEEGMACWLEGRILGRVNCYCFSGGYGDRATRLDKLTDLEVKMWKSAVHGAVKARQDKAFRQIVPLPMTQLSAAEMGKAWSVVDWMVTTDREKFARFLALMKRYWPAALEFDYNEHKGKAQERALQETFGVAFEGLDQQWRAWVEATYPAEAVKKGGVP